MVTVHPQNHSGLIRLSRSRAYVRVCDRWSHDGRDRKKIEQNFPRKAGSYWNRNWVAG